MANTTKNSGAPWVTVGVSGGVAAYKAAELVRALQQLGADVHVVMTRAAQEFVQPLTFSSLTGHRTITSMWGGWGEESSSPTGLDESGMIEHISEAGGADALVIAPATAHVIAKIAHGLADDFLSTMVLATTAPLIVAPAMNVNMWNNPATQANIALLRKRGVTIVEPGSGYLACGMTGAGRLASIDAIAQTVMRVLSPAAHAEKKDLAGETVLITAGGTREAIDPVRYIGNRSSGKMGYALAEAARQRGAEVILVSAATALDPPAGCTFFSVTSAEQMRRAVMAHLPQATVVIGAAAVADFRLATVGTEKLRRNGALHLELEPTEDIVRGVVEARGAGTLVVAFAAEMDDDIEHARKKMQAKGADAIVLNDVSRAGIGFDSERNAASFITAEQAIEIPEMTKREMAEKILDEVLALRAASIESAS
ncbi:MAG: bifunctional phosphopantothenoylcysteine decarboxylase/phosphopantothenate--cysteine ligase CoaBC [Acidobacteriaceae bacterium]|nr:bifunctional phosphopantothenoylcysteine decarboxylase/phosphopantothenate--cysteine ligase CoaBC [Acidobacteriaceae bacterium]